MYLTLSMEQLYTACKMYQVKALNYKAGYKYEKM